MPHEYVVMIFSPQILIYSFIYLISFFIFIDFFLERVEGREGEKESSICCSIYLRIHWLILVCVLTGDQILNLGVSGRCSNRVTQPGPSDIDLNYVTHLVNLFD